MKETTFLTKSFDLLSYVWVSVGNACFIKKRVELPKRHCSLRRRANDKAGEMRSRNGGRIMEI